MRDRGEMFGFRESIFKISHTNFELLTGFPDIGPDVAREPLQLGRWVYEGGRQRAGRAEGTGGWQWGYRPCRRRRRPPPGRSGAPPPESPAAAGAPRGPLPSLPAWGGCPGMPGHLSRRSYAALTTQFIPRRSCAVPYGLPEVLPLAAHACPDPAEGLGPMRGRGAQIGAGDAVLDPEGWALWVTGLCLPLPLSLWGSALGLGSRRGRSPRLLLGRLGAVWGSLRRVPPTADRALGNSEGESGWGPWPRRRKPARRVLRRVRRPVRRPGQPVTKSLPPCKGGLAGPRRHDSYLVDSASSHMLVSKIKPCMSKYKQLYSETANGSLNQLSFI